MTVSKPVLWLVITAQPVTQRDYTETDTQFSTSLVTQGYYTTILRGEKRK